MFIKLHRSIAVPYLPTSLSSIRCVPQVLRLLIKLYESVDNPDWVNIAQCLLFLDDAPEVAKILDKLLKGSEVCTSPFKRVNAPRNLVEWQYVEHESAVSLTNITIDVQDDTLLAFQVCFDLVENESQSFLLKVCPVVLICMIRSI